MYGMVLPLDILRVVRIMVDVLTVRVIRNTLLIDVNHWRMFDGFKE